MEVLQSRLDQLEMARQAQMNAQHTQSLTDIGWGNQIRTYVLHVCSITIATSIDFLKYHCLYFKSSSTTFSFDAALPHGQRPSNQLRGL